jgi:hypothetical protein
LEDDEMKRVKARSFEDARKFARSLKLKSFNDYRKYCKSGKKPDDIPSAPNTVYESKGWISVDDWLGTGVVAYKYKTWRSFKETKRFALSLKLQSFEEWRKYCKSGKKPDDIPDIPSNIYKNKGWKGWPDFLGNKRIVKYTESNTRPFEECKKFIRSLGIKTDPEFQKWARSGKRPIDIPFQPDRTYKEWKGWRDFLGPLPARWRSFEDARKFALSLKLKSPRDWSNFSKSGKRPNDIPANPREPYINKGWKGWSDFLGTGTLNPQQLRAQYYSYNDAKKYVQKQGIRTVPGFYEWSSQGKRPIFIPARPHKFYKELIDWDDFFGREKIVNRSFEDARKYAQSLHLNFNSDWKKLHEQGKIPKDIPKYPDDTYKNKGWKKKGGWGDFLGTGNLSPSDKRKQLKPFEECKAFVRSLGIKTETEWRDWCKNNKRPKGIPYTFHSAYPDQWTTMGEFLGTDVIADKYKRDLWLPAKEARIAIKKIAKEVFGGKPFTPKDWKKAYDEGKIPTNLPKYLDIAYNPSNQKNKRRKKK